MSEIDPSKVKELMDKTAPLIKEIEKLRKSKLIVFWCESSINYPCAYKIYKIFRRLPHIENLDLLIESGGGDINATAKINKIIRSYCDHFNIIVPFFAKSAATLLALGADNLLMCKAGELGPVDPIVQDPATNLFVPAHSIEDALEFISNTEDPLIKVSLADKLNPLLMGAYIDAQKQGIQYLEEILADNPKKKIAIETFTTKFRSHGYPIDREQARETLGVERVIFPDDVLEEKLCDLHEFYADLSTEIKEDILILQTDHLRIFSINGKEIFKQLEKPN